MAELKLSTVWEIKDFAEEANKDYAELRFMSRVLTELNHKSFADVTWRPALAVACPQEQLCKNGFAGFFLHAFTAKDGEPPSAHVWADFNATLLDDSGRAVATFKNGRFSEFSPVGGNSDSWGDNEAFSSTDLSKAVSKAGSLSIRIDLTILKIDQILNCRDLLRGILTNKSIADFKVNVDGECFELHKAVLCGTSTVFARMFESGLEEAADGVLTLPDTTPAAFKAFTQAVYFDNWDFLSEIDLTQDVLYLAEKYNVANLKQYCDDALAGKANEENALAILTNSAALCNAEKTKAACIEILAQNMDFKESESWLDFKKRNRGVALEILDVASDIWIAKCKRLEREKSERDAMIVDLKRKCEEEKEKATSSKRRRK